ncbi:MAG: IS5 family transposase [Candidatus Aenigmarchaeota archaeon]|nr:IS5 family transposase [Candidatus Aenigmarchaeota archaeon]
MKRMRWGKRFKDNRNWVKYNEELVVRGEFLLDLEWVMSWDSELEEMNREKVGAKYQYPESLIKLQAVWYQWIDYRGIEGITRKLVEIAKLPAFNDYTTINRRVNRLDVEFEFPKDKNICVSSDRSGMKFENSGEYRARMYEKRRKFLAVTIIANPLTGELFECDVSLEGTQLSEPEIAEWNMKILMHRGYHIHKFFGDGSFDAHDLFSFCEENKIETAIKIRKTAVFTEYNTKRDRELEEYKKLGYKKWAKKKQYGKRWCGTETIFSAVKRKCGEETRSHIIKNALNEARRKFWAYDWMKSYSKQA